MKNYLKNFSLLLISFAVFTACNSDDDTASNSAPSGSLIATIDGNSFSTMNAGLSITNGVTSLTAVDASTNEQIVYAISEEATEGSTFNVGAGNNIGTAVYTMGSEAGFGSLTEGGSGSITFDVLDEENGLASGTFSFVGVRETLLDDGTIEVETVNVTNGSFNQIGFQVDVAGNSNNTLLANIDGEALNADAVNAINVTFMGNTTTTISAINNSTNQNLTISFPEETPVGDYNLTGGFGADYIATYNPQLGGDTNNYNSQSGTLTITSVNGNSIEGSFNFMATRLDPNDPDVTYNVTNGSFNIEL